MIRNAFPHVYLFRHGMVQSTAYDALSEFGIAFRDALPAFFRGMGVNLTAAYYDASVNRCAATIMGLGCPKVGYAPGHDIRTVSAALSLIGSGHYAVCCRGDSIESGQLYFVHQLELHTPFGVPGYAQVAREALRDSYHQVYYLEFDGHHWSQRWKRRVPITADFVNKG